MHLVLDEKGAQIRGVIVHYTWLKPWLKVQKFEMGV
jgi:hypothetical protein